MNDKPWWLSSPGWDGLLPMAVALGPIVASRTFPRGHIAEVVAVFIVPMPAALVRTHFGWKRLTRLFTGSVPWSRQIALAFAIMLLLFFEIGISLAACVADFPR